MRPLATCLICHVPFFVHQGIKPREAACLPAASILMSFHHYKSDIPFGWLVIDSFLVIKNMAACILMNIMTALPNFS
jgi:hypothetical protein